MTFFSLLIFLVRLFNHFRIFYFKKIYNLFIQKNSFFFFNSHKFFKRIKYNINMAINIVSARIDFRAVRLVNFDMLKYYF